MKNITLQISETELPEVTKAYLTIQNFLAKIVSPNELYTDDFLVGLSEARSELANGEMVEVKNFADFIQ